jgi:anaerobic dimethyl sulfoxide reductase subunit A
MAQVHEGQIMRLDTPPDREDTPNRPRLVPCARGRAHRRLLQAPDRVLTPLRRMGRRGSADFTPISWEEALDLVAKRLSTTRERHGAEAILAATGAGSISGRGFSGASAARRFFSYWDHVTATAGNLSNHCAGMAALWMLGETIPGSDRATLLQSRLIIMWGMNPAENRMGPNTAYFVARARDLGARVILIDPRYTDSAILADQWIPIRPGTDVALVAAVAYVMERDELVDRAFLATHTTGYALYQRYLVGEQDGVAKTPQWAEPITGVPADQIEALARAYATIRPAALLPGWGPQRTFSGEQFSRAMITLACMSGNVGLPGGGLASVGTRSNIVPIGSLPQGPYPPRRHIPSGSWAPYILEDRLDPPIKLAYIVGSNLINRSPNTQANARALEKLDFVVVHEPFFTPTARYADLVLPINTDLERSDLITSWGHDGHLFLSQAAVKSGGESRSDYWAFARLAERLGFDQAYTQGRTEEEWITALLPDEAPAREALARAGLWRIDAEPRVALAEFRAAPGAYRLRTTSGRIEIATAQATRYGLPDIPSYIAAPRERAFDGCPLQLVTPHSKLRSNSCLDTNPWLRAVEPHAVWMHPGDAEARGIVDGQMVEVSNAYGTLLLPAKVTQRIMPGVVCIYQGRWYQPDENGVDVGGCANVLTSHQQSLSGGPTMHTAWVEIKEHTP